MNRVAAVLQTLHCGDDGLIRHIRFHALDSASVEISARRTADGEWVNVRFLMRNLLEFCVRQQPNHSNTVLSSGIRYRVLDGVHCIDFCPFSDAIDTRDDFRQSDLYFAAESIGCEILPYRE